MNNSTTGAAAVANSNTWFPATYTGSDGLAGYEESTGPIAGEYLEHEGIFLFRPTGSSKGFVVSDEDLLRKPIAVN